MICGVLNETAEGKNVVHAFIPVWFRGEEEETSGCSSKEGEREGGNKPQ